MALAACTVGPNFKPPQPPATANWHDSSARMTGPTARVTESSNPDPLWWNRFDDPTLTALMQKAIAGNLDLQQAVVRVAEAVQGEVAARAAGLPSLGASGSYTRDQLGLKGIFESTGVFGQVNSLASPNSPLNSLSPGLGTEASSSLNNTLNAFSAPVNFYNYGMNASWELDLFGRIRRSVEQAKAQTQAQVDATNDALVMLESQVGEAYVALRGAQALRASQQVNIATARDALNLTEQRQSQGLTSMLDVEQARTQLSNEEHLLPGFEQQEKEAMNRLSVLTGQPPGALDAVLSTPAPLPAPPPVIAIGVPSTLARRRPDIRQAEARLHAATANIGVAVASFYPSVSLTGDFGLRAFDASYLTNWASSYYAFGPSISIPVFQGGRLTANLRLARAQTVEAALNYRNTVLTALREVEDALVAYRTDRAARDKLAETVQSGQITLDLARDRYAHGVEDFIQVLNAETTLTTARQSLVQADMALTDDVVALYTALGGGWQDTAGTLPPPAIDEASPIMPAAADSLAAEPPTTGTAEH
ncbi:MAG TPA: efflux transporter outer membrane subunit [Acetobacteraceae bacterium]|nr:efflux transporter outer membrane subunit [Acetobacteraceae bacterium]